MVPNVEECLDLMDKYQMLEHIKAHSLVVATVAHLIARSLKDSGIRISIEKVTAGALMHDIGKTSSLESGYDHSEIGRQICLDNRFNEIADIVGEHVKLKEYHLSKGFSEKEIVFYSDKRVNHDRIVSLDDRLSYILERYGGNNEERCRAIKDNFKRCRAVEKKLFSRLNFRANRLEDMAVDEDIGLP